VTPPRSGLSLAGSIKINFKAVEKRPCLPAPVRTIIDRGRAGRHLLRQKTGLSDED